VRIVSLLPAATEILYAIGAGDSVVGVTHECDFPPQAAGKPALIRPRVDPSAPPAELDRQVAELVRRSESIYAVDAELLAALAPDLVVTQDLCHVCAASPEDLAAALARLPRERRPRVVTFTPRRLADVWEGIREIGAAAGRAADSQALAKRLERNVAAIEHATSFAGHRPGVLCLEWFDPPYVAGHWVPEMVRLAGGRDVLGREAEPSFKVTWDDIPKARPEVIVLMACGYGLERNREAWNAAQVPDGWQELPAVRSGHVYVVDANAYFSRSGPRLVEGLALLGALLHPERVPSALLPETLSAVQRLGIAAPG
jgi:iron complex transport system substrate-binding protein